MHVGCSYDDLNHFIMKRTIDAHRDIWGPIFTAEINFWASMVQEPAVQRINWGIYSPREFGIYPESIHFKKKPRLFSRNGISVQYLESELINTEKTKYFDYCAAEYGFATHRYKRAIVAQAFKHFKPLILPQTRILDCACGPGFETIELSKWVPEGEVVGTDYSSEMVTQAYRNVKNHELENVHLVQADAQELPDRLTGKFDIVFCQLSIGYFEQLDKVSKQFYDALDHAGFAILVEPFTSVWNSLSIDRHRAALPTFWRMYAKEDLKGFFLNAGFSNFYWKEVLPGIGVSIISKHD